MATATDKGRLRRFYDTTVGKKAVMAVTGLVLFGFLLGHMAGNLQVFMGEKKIDDYGHFLHESVGLLWGTRVVLLGCVIAHVVAAAQLTLQSQAARPTPYGFAGARRPTIASRHMVFTGVFILAFVVYHLLHFTTGTVHRDFIEGKVFHNVVTGFRHVPISLFYIACMALLGMHLHHGVFSMFQSTGLSNAKNEPLMRKAAAGIAVVLVLGFISIPIAVLTGFVGAQP